MPTQTRKFLVDDEPATVDHFAPFLERPGFEIKTPTNVEEAPDFNVKETLELIAHVMPPPKRGRWSSAFH